MDDHDAITDLRQELAQLRPLLMGRRERVRPHLDALIERTRRQMTRQPEDGDAPRSPLADMLECLLAYQRGFEVQDRLRQEQPPLAPATLRRY